ncbi:hypothetical protein [Flammeovirga aprica]|uniref:Ig-like domain-containing protein n=1 Tax=Flammeovirga aprica JL-4 TaxID=694437 RepID=A0A7X9S0F6_9BACT|nr:hypothetical protein [Flammeovirga aprica]NME72091.1 hypothetical protein [Flammeovirga aprica JL-4]
MNLKLKLTLLFFLSSITLLLGSDEPKESNTLAVNGGSISYYGSSTICYNATPSTLNNSRTATSTGYPYITYQWQSSTDGRSYTNISGATSTSYKPGKLTKTTYFRRQARAMYDLGYSNSIKITVSPSATTGLISSPPSSSICYNQSPGTIKNHYAPTNYSSIQWQVSTDGKNYSDIPGATGLEYTPVNLKTTSYFRRQITVSCGAKYGSMSVKITVFPRLNGGTIGNDRMICYGTNVGRYGFIGAVLPSGGNGTNSYQWQSSTDGSTFTNIPGAVYSYYDIGTPTSTKYYRRRVTSCTEIAYSNTAKIIVGSPLSGGTVALNSSSQSAVCKGTSGVGIKNISSAKGGLYNIQYQWQSSTDGVNFYDIIYENDNSLTTSTLNSDTYFRRKAYNASCDVQAFSNAILIKAKQLTQTGLLSADNYVIHHDNYRNTTLKSVYPAKANGNYPIIYVWQKSTDGGNTFVDIPNSNSLSYTPNTISTTSHFRRGAYISGCSTRAYTNRIYVQVVDKYTIADGDWNDKTIWSNNKVPEPSDNVYILNDVTMNNPETVNDLIITGKGNLTIQSSSILYVIGKIDVLTNEIIISSGSKLIVY